MDTSLNHHVSNILINDESYKFEVALNVDTLSINITNNRSKISFLNSYCQSEILEITGNAGLVSKVEELYEMLIDSAIGPNKTISLNISIENTEDKQNTKMVLELITSLPIGKTGRNYRYVFELSKVPKDKLEILDDVLKDFYKVYNNISCVTKSDVEQLIMNIDLINQQVLKLSNETDLLNKQVPLLVSNDVFIASTNKIHELEKKIALQQLKNDELEKNQSLQQLKIDELNKLFNRIGELEKLPPRIGELEKLPPRIVELEKLPPRIGELEKLPPRIGELEKLPPRIGELEKLPPRIVELEKK